MPRRSRATPKNAGGENGEGLEAVGTAVGTGEMGGLITASSRLGTAPTHISGAVSMRRGLDLESLEGGNTKRRTRNCAKRAKYEPYMSPPHTSVSSAT